MEEKQIDYVGPLNFYQELTEYPLFVRGYDGNELMRIEHNGDIYLRNNLIGSDKEVAHQFSRVGMTLKQMSLTAPIPEASSDGE